MAETTGIEWADSTVNAWEGCTKISDACRACYAEISSPVRAMEMRIGDFLQAEPSADGKRRLKMWGPKSIRYEMLDWASKLRALNRKARKARLQHEAAVALRHPQAVQLDPYRRPRVFINSLSDTFEEFFGDVYMLVGGVPEIVATSLNDVRERLFAVLDECTELDFLLLTKRPENVLRMVPRHWKHLPGCPCNDCVGPIRRAGWPQHIWIGTTVENQEYADKRIPELLKVPACVRFLSVEPLLGKVHMFPLAQAARMDKAAPIEWVIVGCESGRNPRETKDDWVRALRDQCASARVKFFYKQQMVNGKIVSLPMLDGKQWAEYPVSK